MFKLQFSWFRQRGEPRSSKYTRGSGNIWTESFISWTIRATALLLLLLIHLVTDRAVPFLNLISVVPTFVFTHQICLFTDQTRYSPRRGIIVGVVVHFLTIRFTVVCCWFSQETIANYVACRLLASALLDAIDKVI